MIEIEMLIDTIACIFENKELPTENALFDLAKAQANVITLTHGKIFSEEEILSAVKTIQVRFVHRMPMGALFKSEEYRPWLAERQGDIDWYYWKRYKKLLLRDKHFSPHVVRSLDGITDLIIDHLEDPSKEGEWARRGMVVGHVQSGKTANYTGLICKAADAGYQVIIVLAGVLNSLRNQTQERLDSDFMGWCTRLKDYIGASKFGTDKPRPVCFTTSLEDFKRQAANTIAMGLDAINVPILFVLKKNKSTLENLYRWLVDHNRHNLRDFSMLMIDDEADHASVNTNKEDTNPTAINKAIRDLLSLFSRSSFVGYTATPFANIFIDPENEDEMQNGENYKDLFPKDFILSLDPPDNYIGPHRLFADNADIDSIRTINDNEDLLPVRHKIDFLPAALPDSLKKAVNCLIIARAIRLIRGHNRKHHSMMINVSRFTDVQNFLRDIVSEHVKGIRQAVGNYGALDMKTALRNAELQSLYQTWREEYADTLVDWEALQHHLKSAVDPIEVSSINSKSDRLNYSHDDYPNGRSLIAVGGIGLSRGLTLEGLMVSYFLRNSIMYDTLMQMGRWFGYRDGYEDLCRIFMTDDAEAWYAHITDSTEELRQDFKAMERAGLTPMEFGLRVRAHPTALIVTARNKMRTGRDVPVNISLEGRLAETSVVFSDPGEIEHNTSVLERAIISATEYTEAEDTGAGFLWRGVPSSIVQAAIENYRNHPECMLTYSEPLVEYLRQLTATGQDTCDILLRSVKTNSEEKQIGGHIIRLPERNVAEFDNSKIMFSKRRVASRGDEKCGLPDSDVKRIAEQFGDKTVPDKEYRKYRHEKNLPPLFMINFVKAEKGEKRAIAACFGLSLPGDPGLTRRPKRTVQYRVTTLWWKKNYLMEQEEEEE